MTWLPSLPPRTAMADIINHTLSCEPRCGLKISSNTAVLQAAPINHLFQLKLKPISHICSDYPGWNVITPLTGSQDDGVEKHDLFLSFFNVLSSPKMFRSYKNVVGMRLILQAVCFKKPPTSTSLEQHKTSISFQELQCLNPILPMMPTFIFHIK